MYDFIYTSIKSYNNQTGRADRPACTNPTLHVMMTSPQLGYATNNDGFTVTFTSPMTTKLGMMVDQ